MVALTFDFYEEPENYYPYWLVYEDQNWFTLHQTETLMSWCVANIGPGGRHSGTHEKQLWWLVRGSGEIGFRSKDDAMRFKLAWHGV